MSTFSKQQLTDIIYDYCITGLSQQQIADKFSVEQREISEAMQPYHLTGRNTNFNGSYTSGKNRGGKKKIKLLSDEEIELTYSDIQGYVNANYNKPIKQTIEQYMNRRECKLHLSPTKTAVAILISTIFLETMGITDFVDLIEFKSSGSAPDKTFSQELKEQGTDKLKSEAEDYVLETANNFILDKVSDLTGYQVDYFSYDGYYYSGNKKGKKPDDLCFRHDLNVDTTYDIGYFNGDKISGQCVELNLSNWFVIGEKKKSELNGWCIDKNYNTGVISIAKYKNDTRKGKGILIKDGVTAYVDFDKNSKQLAVLKNGKWIQGNGKELKVKGIEIVNDTMFKIDGIQIGVIYDDLIYKVDSCDIRGNKDSITYINVIEDGTCEVEYQYQKLEYIKIRYENENGVVQTQEIKLSRKE